MGMRTIVGNEDGFTLVELMASLTVMSVGILAATRFMDT